MNSIKIIGLGVAWLAVLTGSAQAYLVDWNASWEPPGIIRFAEVKHGRYFDTPLLKNSYDWDRSVQVWQTFKAPRPASDRWCLKGIALQMSKAAPGGSVDLNVYEGYGVEGHLVSSTKLEWVKSYDAQWTYPADADRPDKAWVGFQLDTPVILTSGKYYTFSLENISANNALQVMNIVRHDQYQYIDKIPIVDLYMQQGYIGGAPRKPDFSEGKDIHKGYRIASPDGVLNYRLLGDVWDSTSDIP